MSEAVDFGLQFRSAKEWLREERQTRKRLSERVIPFNIGYLDDHAIGIYPTDLVILGADTGAGKTTAGLMFGQRAAESGHRVYHLALEAHRAEMEQRRKFRELALMAWHRKMPDRHKLRFNAWLYGRCGQAITPEMEDEAEEAVARASGNYFTFYRDREFTEKDITRVFYAIQDKADLIILDHIHYVDSSDTNENRALKEIVKAVRDAALDLEIPVIAIAHLRKKDTKNPRLMPTLDDFHGSSDLKKIATKAVLLAKAPNEWASGPYKQPTFIELAKDRFQGTSGIIALADFDLRTIKYEDSYLLGRLSSAGDQFHPLEPDEIPVWAERAKSPRASDL